MIFHSAQSTAEYRIPVGVDQLNFGGNGCNSKLHAAKVSNENLLMRPETLCNRWNGNHVQLKKDCWSKTQKKRV